MNLVVTASAGMSVAVIPAGVTFTVTVVIAHNIRIVAEISCKISLYCLISTAIHSAEKPDTCLSKSSLSSPADTAADKNVNAVHCQKARKCTVTASKCGNNFSPTILLSAMS